MEKRISTVSDLHLFCRRSQAVRYMPAIESAAADSDVFVFNGDTFDFRWSCYATATETSAEAVKWLERIASDRPDTRFEFVLGNHDHVQVFIDSLHELAHRTPNFAWHPYYLKLGPALFLHGDVSIRKMGAEDLERFRSQWLHEESRGEFVNSVYDMAFRAKVHRAISKMYFPTRITIERVRHYLDSIGEGEGSSTESVYFGHTHCRINGYDYRGQRFYNGGAPMPGVDFSVMTARVAA
jgi:UDP-2,3-diacylglucosamine pyrophosphatase LpxH